MEVQCRQRSVEASRAPLRVHLRGCVQATHDRQRPKPRHRMVLDVGCRVARAKGQLRGMAGSRELRRRRTAAEPAWETVALIVRGSHLLTELALPASLSR